MITILYILGGIVAYCLFLYFLLFLEKLLLWIEFAFFFYKYGVFDYYILSRTSINKRTMDSDTRSCIHNLVNIRSWSKEEEAVRKQQLFWALCTLFDIASVGMRCHSKTFSLEALTILIDRRKDFQFMTMTMKERKKLQKKWINTKCSCWMYDELEKLKYLDELLFYPQIRVTFNF